MRLVFDKSGQRRCVPFDVLVNGEIRAHAPAAANRPQAGRQQVCAGRVQKAKSRWCFRSGNRPTGNPLRFSCCKNRAARTLLPNRFVADIGRFVSMQQICSILQHLWERAANRRRNEAPRNGRAPRSCRPQAAAGGWFGRHAAPARPLLPPHPGKRPCVPTGRGADDWQRNALPAARRPCRSSGRQKRQSAERHGRRAEPQKAGTLAASPGRLAAQNGTVAASPDLVAARFASPKARAGRQGRAQTAPGACLSCGLCLILRSCRRGSRNVGRRGDGRTGPPFFTRWPIGRSGHRVPVLTAFLFL